MPKQGAAAILGEILSEADALIRLRLKEQGLELPHLVVGATPDNQIDASPTMNYPDRGNGVCTQALMR